MQRILAFGEVRLSVPRALPAPRGLLGDLAGPELLPVCHSLIPAQAQGATPERSLQRPGGPLPTREPAEQIRGDTHTRLGVPVG